MKKSELQKLIREEVSKVLKEAPVFTDKAASNSKALNTLLSKPLKELIDHMKTHDVEKDAEQWLATNSKYNLVPAISMLASKIEQVNKALKSLK